MVLMKLMVQMDQMGQVVPMVLMAPMAVNVLTLHGKEMGTVMMKTTSNHVTSMVEIVAQTLMIGTCIVLIVNAKLES